MDNFQAIGQLVTEARNLLDSIKGGAIRVMQNQFDALLITLDSAFNLKLASYQQQVNSVVKPSIDVVYDSFEEKKVSVDFESGDDNSLDGPFKTIFAAVNSVPDGGSIQISLPYNSDGTSKIIDFDDFINVGNRRVTLLGGYAGMENDGFKMSFLRPAVENFQPYNWTHYKGRFVGREGGVIRFRYCGIILPRLLPGTVKRWGDFGSFVGRSVKLAIHNPGMTGSHIKVDGSSGLDPMLLYISDSHDLIGSMNALELSFVNIETANQKPLISLESSGVMGISAYSSVVSDQSGSPVKWSDILSGVTYGSHGYATNLIAHESIAKQGA